MRDRRQQLIEAAVRCFARKGFHATSIQEIADELGMAKGSLYFYFKSKDELLVSIFEHYGDQLYDRLAELPGEESLPPRERLRLQLERQFDYLGENREFIQMVLKEPHISLHEGLDSFLKRFRSRFMHWVYGSVKGIYGDEAKRYWADGALLLSGMLGQLMETMLLYAVPLDRRRVAEYIVRRLDDSIAGLLASGERPLLDEESFRLLAQDMGEPTGWIERLERVKEAIAAVGDEGAAELDEAVARLEAELARPAPARIVVRGLLALLEREGGETLRGLVSELAEALREP